MKTKHLFSVVFVFLVSFELISPLHVSAEGMLDMACFREKSSVDPASSGTVEVRVFPGNHLFFAQDNMPLSFRTYQYGKDAPLDVKIVNISGIDSAKEEEQKYLLDGNNSTSLEFDPYSEEPREIVIDAGMLLMPRSFHFELQYVGKQIPFFSVSRDGKTFISVSDVKQHSFRFLKIRFENSGSSDSTKNTLSVSEISLSVPEKNTYVVALKNSYPFDIFSGFDCEQDDAFRKTINALDRQSQNTSFRVDIDTEVFDVQFSPNPTYNLDRDGDGITNDEDNCPLVSNVDQKDGDGDLVGDACDLDRDRKNFSERDADGDGIGDSSDNCPYLYNPRQLDGNADRRGDICSDDDNDGIIGEKDNCPTISNSNQKDINANGIGDACEFDQDDDGIFDSIDNCVHTKNPDQVDADNDQIGDACDNCEKYNPQQRDVNGNGVGDTCEEAENYQKSNDDDADGVLNISDNCRNISNPDQVDTDNDQIGDKCDNCPLLQNNDQTDEDQNGVGDFCEDSDQDGIVGYLDNCLRITNADQKDSDNDNIGDVCEDEDDDGIPAVFDNCPFQYNVDQKDVDHDTIGDACDTTDNRFLESNKWVVVGIIVALTAIFGVLIVGLIRKIHS